VSAWQWPGARYGPAPAAEVGGGGRGGRVGNDGRDGDDRHDGREAAAPPSRRRHRAAGIVLLASLALAAALSGSWLVTPDLAQVRATTASSERWLLDRHGEPLHALRVDDRMRRLAWVPLAQISPALVEAVIEAEDRRFRRHLGVDGVALAAAVHARLTGAPGTVRGASTLTMQLAALLDPSLSNAGARRTPWHKLRQIAAAARIGLWWRHDDILEAYLNLVPLRGELQGIDAAARGLFDKAPSALDQAESALLAALLARPNAAPTAVAQRACRLAQRMAQPLPCERLHALAADRFARAPRIAPGVALAPHVARSLLVAPPRGVPGATGASGAAGAAQRAGSAPLAAVRSTLDRDLQRHALELLQTQLEALAGRNVRDGALLVVDNASGDVLAYVGNAGERSSARFVDGVQAPRQAGSTL
jgi:penicillin-binding protein 1C